MHIIWYNRTDELNAIIRFRDKDRGFRKNLQGKRNIFHVFLFTGVKADTLVQNAITNVLASTPIFRYIYFHIHIHVDVIWLLRSESLQGRGSRGGGGGTASAIHASLFVFKNSVGK